MPADKIEETAIKLLHSKTIAKGIYEFTYKGDSMAPMLSEGDILLAKKISPETLRLGDIIVYKNQNQFIVHRFIYRKVEEGNIFSIVAKADNLHECDKPFPSNSILGRAIIISKANKQLRINTKFWKFASFFIGVMALLEVMIFTTVGNIRLIFFRKLKIKKEFREKIGKLISIPKRIFTKILIG